MSFDDSIHALISRIHRTGSEGGAWIDVAAEIGQRIGAFGTSAILHRTDRPEVLGGSAMAGYRDIDVPSVLEDYAAHFHMRNPQALFERARPEALFYLDGRDPIFTSENFPDFTKWERARMGAWHHATAYCRPTDHLVYGFAFSGSKEAGPFSLEDLDLFHLLTYHLRQAVSTSYQLGLLGCTHRPEHDALRVHLEGLRRGAAILDRLGKVRFANAALRAMARDGDGIRFADGELRFAKPNNQASYKRLCASAAALLGGAAGYGGALSVERPSGRKPYVVKIAPLFETRALEPLVGDALLVTVTDLDAALDLACDLLRKVFGLTPAEARFSARLVASCALDEAAQRSGITIGTARTHLKSIFAKTGATSQTGLVALLKRLEEA